MELEKDTTKNFIDYLKEHGYPENSLATEYKIGVKYRADIVVIDPVTNSPIMIFELKSKKTNQLVEAGKKQIRNYLDSLPDNSIPAYLVFPKIEYPYFEVIRVNPEENLGTVRDIDNISYSSQRIARLSEKVKQTENEKKDTIDKFSYIAWILAFLIAVLFIVRKVWGFDLNAVDLSLLAGIIGLVLIPFANKIKFLGVEFERLNKAKIESKD